MGGCTREQIDLLHREQQLRHSMRIDVAKKGVVIVTASRLIFLEADKDGDYATRDSLSIKSIKVIEMERAGLSRRMRLDTGAATKRFYFVTLMGPMGQQQDLPKNEQLFEHLKRQAGPDVQVKLF
jgi:hypothetical protein